MVFANLRPPLDHPLVEESKLTSWACPEQYEGTLTTGETFYFRYRCGVASVGVGPDLNSAVHDSFHHELTVSEDPLEGNFSSISIRDETFATLLADALRDV